MNMEKIIVENITKRQKLTIRNGINTYLFIQDNLKEGSDDFRDVYYDFYLKARSSVFAKKKTDKETKQKIDNPNWETYFDLLDKTEVTKPKAAEKLKDVVEYLSKNLTSKSFEFSFATKLLHTKCDEIPIYDSKVRKYLNEVYGKKFKTSSKNNIENIQVDWNTINTWYNDFLKEDESKKWISWFDKEFPEGKELSKIKKIDFIIFACTE